MLKRRFTKLLDVMPANFRNIGQGEREGGGGGVVLAASRDKILNFSVVPRYYGQDCVYLKEIEKDRR